MSSGLYGLARILAGGRRGAARAAVDPLPPYIAAAPGEPESVRAAHDRMAAGDTGHPDPAGPELPPEQVAAWLEDTYTRVAATVPHCSQIEVFLQTVTGLPEHARRAPEHEPMAWIRMAEAEPDRPRPGVDPAGARVADAPPPGPAPGLPEWVVVEHRPRVPLVLVADAASPGDIRTEHRYRCTRCGIASGWALSQPMVRQLADLHVTTAHGAPGGVR